MKRMNVREFRAQVANLGDEPIEVVRYSETIGFWIPRSLTKEPRYSGGTWKPTLAIKTTGPAEEEFKRIAKEVSRITREYRKVFDE